MVRKLSQSYDRQSALRRWLRPKIKAARQREALWVHLLDLARLTPTAEGRAVLWTRLVHRNAVHQTSPYTREDRYPRLFDAAAALAPRAARILSFGCSTGEELLALRRRFPGAEIVGAEINPRSRRVAQARIGQDDRIKVISPKRVTGTFDIAFALAVLQREPHKIAEMGVEDLTPFYDYQRFDATVRQLADSIRPGGLLVVTNAQYRIEDSSVANQFEPLAVPSSKQSLMFGADGRRLADPSARTIFRKRH